MAILKRLLAVAIAAAVLMLIGGGTAFAQDRPSVPPPSEGPALNLPVQDGQNDFQKTFEECKNNIPDDMEGAEKWIDEHIGIIQWANDAADNVSCTMDATDAHPGDAFSTLLTNTASTFWDDPVGKLTKAVMEGNVAAFSTVMTFWISVPIPGLTGGEAMSGIRNLTWEIQLVAFVIGMIIAASKLAIARQQAVAEGADETAKMLVRTVFSAGLLPTLVIIFHLIGDVFSTWVLQQASGGDLNAKVTAIAWVDEKTGLGPVLALVLTGLGLLGSVSQLIALLVREAILAVVVGLAPIAAAQSATGTGRQSWSTMMGFVIAALLFKPVASLLYVFAFWTSSSNVVSSAVIGSVLLAVAGLSLPSLMKAIGPVDAGGGGGAQQAAAMAGATGAVLGSAAALGSRGSSPMSKAGGAGNGSSGGGKSGGSGSKGSPASGARSAYGGRFSGGASGARSAAAAAARTLGRTGTGVAGAVGAGTRTAATAAGALGRGAASAGQAVTQGTASAAHIASGAVGDYHGQIPR